MKYIFTLFLFVPVLAFGQMQGDSVYVSNGCTFKVGQPVKFGLGTMPNGEFKYSVEWNIAAKADSKMPASYAATSVPIKKIVVNKLGFGKNAPKKVMLVFGAGVTRYAVEADAALLAKEIICE